MQSLLKPGPLAPGRLSSSMTAYHKFVVPFISVAVSVPWTILAIRGDLSGTEVLVLPILALYGVGVYWTGVRLKRVTLDGETLRISNYRKEIRVPLRDAAVCDATLANFYLITLRFNGPTEFGASIVFMPKLRWLIWGPHPLVQDLRFAIQEAQRSADQTDGRV